MQNNNDKQQAGFIRQRYIKQHKELINGMQKAVEEHKRIMRDLYGK